MERRIPIEWLEEWARITDNEELMEVLVGDWAKEWFEKPYWFHKDKLIRDDVILRTYNNDGQFCSDHRRHYDVELIAVDYGEDGNNMEQKVLYKALRHFSRKELEDFAREQVVQKLGDHHDVSFVATPRSFSVAECFHNRYISGDLQNNTKVADDGQIGFKL